METELSYGGKRLIPVTTNLIDLIWTERPPRPLNQVVQHPMQFAGKSISDKLEDVRKEMSNEGVEVLIVAELDEVACMKKRLFISNYFVL